MTYNGKKHFFGVRILHLFYVGTFCQILSVTRTAATNPSDENKEYLLVQITSPSASPGYYLFDPKQENATLCALTQIEDSKREAWMPEKCPPELIAAALRLSNNLTDPSSERYSAFSAHGLHHVQIMNGGYFYRHPKRKHCIYWVQAETGEETPYYCTGVSEEILQFKTSPQGDYLYMVLPISSDSHVLRDVKIEENKEISMEFSYRFQILCRSWGNWLCAILNGSINFSNLPFRLDKPYTPHVGNVGEGPPNVCFQPPEFSLRSQITQMNHQAKYILAVSGGCNGEILELNETDNKYRVVWQASEDFYSQEHHVSFTTLKEGEPFLPQKQRPAACGQCTGSCPQQYLCPYTVVNSPTGLPLFLRFVIYDESWELPLFGREELELTNVEAVDSGIGKSFQHVSNMAAMNRDNSLCWTYRGDENVRCRNLVQKQKKSNIVGKIHPLSTMLVFGLNGDEMFYNDGNCGQVYMHSFRFEGEYRFPPYSGRDDQTCDSRDFVLDTENKILFWVANNSVSAHVLFHGTPGNRKISVTEKGQASTGITHSIAADVGKREVYTYSSSFSLCKIKYAKIFDAAESLMIDAESCQNVHLNYGKVSQLQVWGGYLFGLTGGIENSLGLSDTSKGLLLMNLQKEALEAEVVDLLYLHAAGADGNFNWTYIIDGLQLKKNNSAPSTVGDSLLNSDAIAPADEHRISRLANFRMLIFLSPAKTPSSEVNPCEKGACSKSLCFLQLPMKEDPICACPENMDLVNSTTCKEKAISSYLDWIIAGSISASVLLLAAVSIVGFFLVRAKRQNNEMVQILHDIHEGDPEAEAAAPNPLDKVMYQPLTCTIPATDLIVDRKTVLGEGNFGLVLKGDYKGVDVAIKTPKLPINSAFLADMVKEAKIMNYIGDHPHIVKIYGAEVSQVEQGKMFIALEFSPSGCLLSKLKKMGRNTGTELLPGTSRISNIYQNSSMETELREKLFLNWAEQIASGMHYLSTKNVFHGDLATRNILVFPDDVLKISDFGLSRRLNNYSNYTKGDQTPLPWRWMAYESLTRLEFSIKSDVWAYGVTLWEIFTLGNVPHSNKEWNNEFVEGLARNEVLNRPAHASQTTYDRLMRPCWFLEPEERPDFAQILDTLSKLKEVRLCLPKCSTIIVIINQKQQ